jgi:hypothetical protein
MTTTTNPSSSTSNPSTAASSPSSPSSPPSSIRRSVLRRTAGLALAGMAMLSTVVLDATPASAHSLSQAVANGCGSSYEVEAVWGINGRSGSVVGHLILARVQGTQRFCAVTNKVASHGSNTRTEVCIKRHRDLLSTCDRGSYSHFANVTAFDGRYRCIRLHGEFDTTNGVLAGSRDASYANGASCA